MWCHCYLVIFIPQILALEENLVNEKISSEGNVENVSESAVTEEIKEHEEQWISKAVMDVAFVIRRHKFNGHDIRYTNKTLKKYMHLNFPDPPLRNIHWQVRSNCELSFKECIKYLFHVVNQGSLIRESNPYGSGKISQTNEEILESNKLCLKLLQNDNNNFEVFKDRLEKFQWLVSASYFMCWYTYQEEKALEKFNEPCDNFGGCLDQNGKFSNGDVRSNNDIPFACALYSFCPDPCCENRLLLNEDNCLTPCEANLACSVDRLSNTDWNSVLLNHWNITCSCTQTGMRWSSEHGLCIDIDECFEKIDKCDRNTQTCMNLKGSYKCACAFGYKASIDKFVCHEDVLLRSILHPKTSPPAEKSWLEWYQDWVEDLKS